MSTALPEILKSLRGARPVEAVASTLGVARSTVYGWEADLGSRQYRRIDPANLRALLAHYGATQGSPEWISAWTALSLAPASDSQALPDQAA